MCELERYRHTGGKGLRERERERERERKRQRVSVQQWSIGMCLDAQAAVLIGDVLHPLLRLG